MASLAECRRIVHRARRRGLAGKRTIMTNKAACDLHNPGQSPMCGSYVVVNTCYDPIAGAESARYLWE